MSIINKVRVYGHGFQCTYLSGNIQFVKNWHSGNTNLSALVSELEEPLTSDQYARGCGIDSY